MCQNFYTLSSLNDLFLFCHVNFFLLEARILVNNLYHFLKSIYLEIAYLVNYYTALIFLSFSGSYFMTLFKKNSITQPFEKVNRRLSHSMNVFALKRKDVTEHQ